jgi:cardiolipin synthase A/B
VIEFKSTENMDLLEALASRAFCRVAEAQQSSGNQVRILRDGRETFPAWLQAISRASKSVHLENYIIQEDEIGEAFSEAIVKASRRGVECRILYDWLGCMSRTSRKFWRRLAAEGAQVRQYNPPRFGNPLRLVSRDHRKVLCVDGTVAFTGGLCIGHDWVGNPARGIPPWRDTAIEIHGPAVAHVEAAFLDSWGAAIDSHSQKFGLPFIEGHQNSGVDVSVIAGRPETMGLYRLEQLVAEVVERSLWLTDGYFVATTGYVRALVGAARAGVDVRLLVPGSSNWPLVGALSKSAYRPLLQAGVRVFEWNGPMLHAKTAVADGCWSRIGSSNSNLASWVSNRELDVTIKDRELAVQMERIYLEDLQGSTEVVLTKGHTGIKKPVASTTDHKSRHVRTTAGRLLSSTIGLGNTLGASFSQRRTVQPAEGLVICAGGVALILLALIAFALPRLVAWTIALIALWPGIGLLVQAWRLWRLDGESGQ